MTQTVTNTVQQQPSFRKKFRKFIILFLLSLIAIWFIYYFICGFAYSRGTRSGILTKVSEKGWIFKTFEGEMNIGGFSQGDGTIMPASVFKFSVADRKIYNELDRAQGHKVVLRYKQVYKNFFWQGESDYFIEEVSPVK